MLNYTNNHNKRGQIMYIIEIISPNGEVSLHTECGYIYKASTREEAKKEKRRVDNSIYYYHTGYPKNLHPKTRIKRE